jgi:hypothetical protein
MCQFFVVVRSAVNFNLENPGTIPAHPMTFFMQEHFRNL